jgi:predicted ATPase
MAVEWPGIRKISVEGYKSIVKKGTIDIKPITILSGANSSGKSSFMQPLLLLKQTLESTFDPGTLLIHGSHVKFTAAEQFFSNIGKGPRKKANVLRIGFETSDGTLVEATYSRGVSKGIQIEEMEITRQKEKFIFKPGMKHEEIQKLLIKKPFGDFVFFDEKHELYEFELVRTRCFLDVVIRMKNQKQGLNFHIMNYPVAGSISNFILSCIHLPGLRGTPERNYSVTAFQSPFTGTFEVYTATVILKLQKEKDGRVIRGIVEDLEKLGLTWKVSAIEVDETRIELRVGRLPHPVQGGAQDLVNIADVGFGVSQTLPVIVALNVATAGQIVYVEQPEIHLHPKAQSGFSEIVAAAARRGVRVILETHSDLLIKGIQTKIALGQISPEDVGLNWFSRSELDGSTEISSAEIDRFGSFGDWPEDFAEVKLKAEQLFLDAVEKNIE